MHEQLLQKDLALLSEHRPVLLEMPHLLAHLDKDVDARRLASEDDLCVLVNPCAADRLMVFVEESSDSEPSERAGQGDALVEEDAGVGEGERESKHVGAGEVQVLEVELDVRSDHAARRWGMDLCELEQDERRYRGSRLGYVRE